MKVSSTSNIIIIGLFVDDILSSYMQRDAAEWKRDEARLKKQYELNDLGDVQHILGMRVTTSIDKRSLTIDQHTYITDKLKEFGFEHTRARTISSPAEISSKHTSTDQSLEYTDKRTYQAIVGSLISASCSTRRDITHATNMVARKMSTPTANDMIKAKRVLRYLNTQPNLGLLYTPNHHQGDELTLTAYCDADWAGDLNDRKSTTGYCTFINDNLIDRQSKKQPTVALSSTEAEYMSIVEVAKEVIWMTSILTELRQKVHKPIIIYVDNQSAIKISENDTSHQRTKHIDIRHHFIRDLINNKSIVLKYIRTTEQRADIFPKALPPQTFIKLRDMLTAHRTTSGQSHNTIEQLN